MAHKTWQFVSPSLTALAIGALFVVTGVQAAEKTGREVVEQTCVACHASGKDGAPRIGDSAAWSLHSKNGLSKLTENAISGIGKMPAHGGQPNLTDLEISRAIAYMVSGGTASDPTKPYSKPTSITAEQLVQNHCMACHASGKDGAPRSDDFQAWKPRLAKGLEGLTQSAIAGHKSMPSRAGLGNLSDTDVKNAVTYLVVQSAIYKAK